MSDTVHRRSTVCNIHYHIVWSTKRRRRVIIPQLETDIRTWADEAARKYGFQIDLMEAGHRDHIHWFISAPPTIPISRILNILKGCTSRQAFQKYPFLLRVYPKRHMWNPATYVETIGSVSEDAIEHYIRQQDKDAVTSHRKGGSRYGKGQKQIQN